MKNAYSELRRLKNKSVVLDQVAEHAVEEQVKMYMRQFARAWKVLRQTEKLLAMQEEMQEPIPVEALQMRIMELDTVVASLLCMKAQPFKRWAYGLVSHIESITWGLALSLPTQSIQHTICEALNNMRLVFCVHHLQTQICIPFSIVMARTMQTRRAYSREQNPMISVYQVYDALTFFIMLQRIERAKKIVSRFAVTTELQEANQLSVITMLDLFKLYLLVFEWPKALRYIIKSTRQLL